MEIDRDISHLSMRCPTKYLEGNFVPDAYDTLRYERQFRIDFIYYGQVTKRDTVIFGRGGSKLLRLGSTSLHHPQMTYILADPTESLYVPNSSPLLP